jgi:hypothetical protein
MARKTFEIEEIKVIKHKIPVTEHKLPKSLRKFAYTREGSRGSYLAWRADMSNKEREEAAQTIINDMADNVIVKTVAIIDSRSTIDGIEFNVPVQCRWSASGEPGFKVVCRTFMFDKPSTGESTFTETQEIEYVSPDSSFGRCITRQTFRNLVKRYTKSDDPKAIKILETIK